MDKFFKPISHNELEFSTCNVLHGSCLDRLKEIPDGTIDAVVCDPPYHLQSIVQRFSSPDAAPAQSKESGVYARSSRGFMGQTWDGGDIAFRTDVWRECLRVLKAGGHLVAFGGTRTVHRIACAIEDSGFEIRDMISWLYFSGFPKSLNISKAIDNHFNAEREIIGVRKSGIGAMSPTSQKRTGYRINSDNWQQTDESWQTVDITKPATPEAQHWAGYGTALKPAQEPAILARKPIEAGSIAKQVLATGTGAINIDGCRFSYGDSCWVGPNDPTGDRSVAGGFQNVYVAGELQKPVGSIENPLGRWPANIYQCAKPSRAEKEQGLEHLEPTTGADAVGRTEGSAGLDNPRAGAGRTAAEIRNIHPTVKPLKLMRWLVRLVTPEGGTVLDPFAGSGTTLCAAMLENRHSIGCELTAEYLPIIHGRVQWAIDEYYRENQQLLLPW